MIQNNLLNCKFHTMNSELFRNLTYDEHCMINDNQFKVKFNDGELIFKQGSPCIHMMMVISGLGKQYLEGENNKNLTLKFLKPNDFVCCSGLYIDNRHHFSVRAIEPITACFVETESLKGLLKQNALFAENYITELNRNINFAYHKLMNYSQKSQEGRLADVLVFLHEQIYSNNHFQINISKYELAEYADISKESVFRILRQFTKDKIILNTRNQIEIIRIDILKNIVLNDYLI